MRFGYLPQTDFETGNLRTEDQLRDAIKNLQVSKYDIKRDRILSRRKGTNEGLRSNLISSVFYYFEYII